MKKNKVMNWEACAIKTLDDAPTIEPERKKGHWIVCDILQEVKCSECRMCFRHKAKFCPNCKADMRGETDERER